MTIDTPEWNRPLDSILLPALKATGHPVDKADVQRIPAASTTSDAGRQAQAVSSAVLRLRSDGVTHLVMLDASATVTIFFSQAAKNQGYYPRLGANSATGMQALTDAGIGGNDIFEGAVGLGWFPNLDLPRAEAAKRQVPATKDCLAVIKKRTGQDLSAGNGASIALASCDSLFFLKAVGDRADGRLDQAGLVATAEGLGTGFTAALYGKTRFAPGRHDALETGYDMAWDTGCTCAKYKGSFDIP
jgi:ABC-type branched-subunit amino acid transport system substrate-binding protein